jgi:putative transposase
MTTYLTPDKVYASVEGGGAMIVDKYGSVSPPEEDASSEGKHAALP